MIVTFRWLFLFVAFILSGCMLQTSDQLQTQSLNSSSISIHDGHIEYYRFGKGSPIILIPGYVTDVSSWDRKFLIALAQHHELIVLNNRNVGRSYVKSTHYTSKDLANDVSQLIHKLKLKKPTVLGISMGGMIAQQLAVLHPEQVGHLILINTMMPGKKAILPSENIKMKMQVMPKNLLDRYISAIELFFPPSSQVSMAYVLVVERFQPNNYKETNPEVIVPQQQEVIRDWVDDDATANKIKKLTIKTLVLSGKADIVIPPINSIILARTISHAKFSSWQNGGHGMIFQYPHEIAQRINQFLFEQN